MVRSDGETLPLHGKIIVQFPHDQTMLWVRIAPPHTVASQTLASWWQILDTDEQAKISRLISNERRREALAAHGLLRKLVGNILSMPAHSFRFIRNTNNGKPALDTAILHGIDVNLTHCPGLVGCAAATRSLIGIDVEPIDRPIALGAAHTLFAAEERDWLASQPLAKAQESFIRLWTLKEAVLKATGSGLSHDLASFAVLPSPARVIRLPENFGALTDWQVWQQQPTPQHMLAVAVWRKN